MYCILDYTGEGVSQDKAKGIETWNELAYEAWIGQADIKNLIPSILARHYIDWFGG